MSRHTPGPWVLETTKSDIGHVHKIQPLRACLYVDNRRSDPSSAPEALANARLIAAAPELLEALKALLAADVEPRLCSDCYRCKTAQASCECFVTEQRWFRLQAEVVVAIKRAEGES